MSGERKVGDRRERLGDKGSEGEDAACRAQSTGETAHKAK
jgi:hypothetical protein